MVYLDYVWELDENCIVPDRKLNTDKLGWEEGDLWVVKQFSDGKKYLVKVLSDG